MTRAALVLALLTAGPASALADGSSMAGWSDVGPAPWSAVAGSQIFAPDDAYVFADPDRTAKLSAEAEAAASLIDRQRMAKQIGRAELDETGRVALAFADFVAYGPQGQASASAALARADGAPVRVAASAPLSLAAFALAAR